MGEEWRDWGNEAAIGGWGGTTILSSKDRNNNNMLAWEETHLRRHFSA